MKKLLLIISALFFSILGFSQGIVFEHGAWIEVLEKAQKTNKPIFINVYNTSSGPCKIMNKNIFPLEEVSKVYNANFICYQIDAEKGEGIEIATIYGVKTYPTFLFIKGNGTLFTIAVGSMPAKEFSTVAKTALLEMNDPNPSANGVKEHIANKNNPTILLDSINKCLKLGKSTTLQFDEYLKLIPEEERTSSTVVEWYKIEGRNMKVNSLAYTNLRTNSSILDKKLTGFIGIYLSEGILNTMRDAAETKNEKLLATAILAYDQLPENNGTPFQKDEVYMRYYEITEETDKYFKHAINFADNYLMKLNIDTITQKDKNSLQYIDSKINEGAFGMFNSGDLDALKSYAANAEKDKISNSLNQIARNVFEKVRDKIILLDALSWSKRSVELIPNNALFLDTYANLCYKTGQKKEAIIHIKEALRNTDVNNIRACKRLVEILRKMNAGEKTWR